MSFRDGQEQSVDVRQAQLTVALQDRRRSLMIAFAGTIKGAPPTLSEEVDEVVYR